MLHSFGYGWRNSFLPFSALRSQSKRFANRISLVAIRDEFGAEVVFYEWNVIGTSR
jgi:hypothetical protein